MTDRSLDLTASNPLDNDPFGEDDPFGGDPFGGDPFGEDEEDELPQGGPVALSEPVSTPQAADVLAVAQSDEDLMPSAGDLMPSVEDDFEGDDEVIADPVVESHPTSSPILPSPKDDPKDDPKGRKWGRKEPKGSNKVRTQHDENVDTVSDLIDAANVGKKGRKLIGKFAKSSLAREAAGGQPKEVLVRHEKQSKPPKKSMKEVLHSIRRVLYSWIPFLTIALGPSIFAPEMKFAKFYVTHVTFSLFLLIPLVMRLTYSFRNHQRTHPPQPARGKPKKLPQPPLPPARQWAKDIWDIVANLDHIGWRLTYLALYLGATVMTGKLYPAGVDTFKMLQKDPNLGRVILLSIVGPAVAYAVPWTRCAKVIKERWAEIEEAYIIAKATLGYPKTMPRNASPRQMKVATSWLAIDVKKWSALYEIDKFFVTAPEDLSIDDVQKWDAFAGNLNAKLPRPEEWRVQRDSRGRGAEVGPANYPTAVLWDGDFDNDPLTFRMGVNLETGETQMLTFSDVSPHMAVSGGTSSGKEISLSTIIKTPSGSRFVRDLKVGDDLFDEAGRVVHITAMSDVETPEKAYRVVFHDGTSVVVDSRHLWTTWDRAARRAAGRQRAQGALRAHQPWLSDDQRAILAREIELSGEGDDISLPQVAELLDICKDTVPLVEEAKAIGVCRESSVVRDFVYADQEVVQTQTCMVFDRTEVQVLVNAMANSPRSGVREAAKTVKVLERNGDGPVSIPELTQATGIDRARMCGLLKRSGVTTLRKETVPVRLTAPGKVVQRSHPNTTFFYPKRPLLAALIERGLLDKHDQRDKMALPAVRTTQEIAETLRYRAAGVDEDAASWANHSIPRAGAAQFPERDLLLNPYVLGAWLGDGSSYGATSWASEDPELMEEIASAGFGVRPHKEVLNHVAYYVTGLRTPLRQLGLLRNKHIPDSYLHASIEQRLALLQGLMDTDGSVNKTSGTCEFYQSNEDFARQVRSLVASLGMIAHIRSKQGGYRKPSTGEWVDCKEAWKVSFTPTMQVFRLSRKAELIDPEANRSKSEHRYVVAVEEVEPEPMRCIMVDSDSHQFLVTDQYVPTHNTSLAEIVAAQVLVKPMPWDPELHGMVYVVDPKGPFARRWIGRPGVVVANGQEDAGEPDDEGVVLTGIEIMANCLRAIEEEHQRRQSILKRYPDVATWVHLPDDVKREEKFFPIVVILDEYIDHTDREKANGDEVIERENAAKDYIQMIVSKQARKYRNVGMHTILIAQEVKMTGSTGIGSALMRQLPVRGVTGQMDPSQLLTMFGTPEVPALPSSRVVIENGERRVKTIPGRARLMNALGQQIHKVQIMYFGGKTNSDTLDKWLPRGEAPLNGDFTPPRGKPRTFADFDQDGNFIGESTPTIIRGELADDLPSADSKVNDSMVDDDEMSPYPDEDLSEEGADPDAVFPVAKVEKPRCDEAGCVNDAAKRCSSCGGRRCEYHLEPAADPGYSALVCHSCYSESPLVSSGAASVYKLMHSLALKAGLVPSYALVEDDEGVESIVVATVLTSRGQKVVQVTAAPGADLVARSKSGMVTGADVEDRVSSVISTYIDRKINQEKGGES